VGSVSATPPRIIIQIKVKARVNTLRSDGPKLRQGLKIGEIGYGPLRLLAKNYGLAYIIFS
jgi:hypothetical protein